jgi:hypothetical protein
LTMFVWGHSLRVAPTNLGTRMLTATECRAKALEKLAQAKQDKRHRRKLKSAAEAWLFLAEKLERIERFEDLVALALKVDGDPDIDGRAAEGQGRALPPPRPADNATPYGARRKVSSRSG